MDERNLIKKEHTKLNVDTLFYVETCKDTTGVVLQDEKDIFVADNNDWISSILDTPTVEAQAFVMVLAGHVGCNKLH